LTFSSEIVLVMLSVERVVSVHTIDSPFLMVSMSSITLQSVLPTAGIKFTHRPKIRVFARTLCTDSRQTVHG